MTRWDWKSANYKIPLKSKSFNVMFFLYIFFSKPVPQIPEIAVCAFPVCKFEFEAMEGIDFE